MADLHVHGGRPLEGAIVPSGNKNSVLPLLCASLLTDETVTLRNIPAITDVEKLVAFFQKHGSSVDWNRGAKVLTLNHGAFKADPGRLSLPEGMRSSVLLFAPLVQRLGAVRIAANAKGCALGVREIDPHIDNLRCFGAVIDPQDRGLVRAPRGGLRGGHQWQDYMSVTATESFVMAGALANGSSVLMNAASEPHVQDLCGFLSKMGAKVEGTGTSRLTVQGVDRLGGTDYRVPADYHEVTTFLALGAVTGGAVEVTEAEPEHYDLIIRSFKKLGVVVKRCGEGFSVEAGQKLAIEQPLTSNLLPKIEAAPWPYFPVDLLPVMVALSTRCKGAIQFWNKVYEGGFAWLPELVKFGAHAVVSDPHRVIVFGDCPLRPAVVESPYIIRAAVALFMLAASIPGESTVKNADPIKRAHPFFVENLRHLGAEVDWV